MAYEAIGLKMIKKIFVSVLLFLLIGITFVFAATTLDSTGNQIENIAKSGNKIFDSQSRADLLKEAWSKWIFSTETGKQLSKITDFFKTQDSIFTFIFGLGFDLTWKFMINILLWIFFLIIIYRTIKEILLIIWISNTKNRDFIKSLLSINWIFSLIGIIIFVQLKIILWFSDKISLFVNSFTVLFSQIITMVIIFIILIIILYYSKAINRYSRSKIKQKEEIELKKDVENLKGESKTRKFEDDYPI